MADKIYSLDDKLPCPHCGESIEGVPARDFFVWDQRGIVDPVVSDECGNCYGEYRLHAISNGDVLVEKL